MITLNDALTFVGSATIDEVRTIENALDRRLDQLDEEERQQHLQAIAPMIDDTIRRMEYHKSGQAQRDLVETARLAGRLPSDEPSPQPVIPGRSVEQVKREVRERTKKTLGVEI